MNKVLVLASGGLDSSVLLAMYRQMNYDVAILYIDYGQANKDIERKKLWKLMSDLKITNYHEVKTSIPWSKSSTTGGEGSLYVEMRNLIFISYAISACEALGIDLLSLGYIKTEDDYNDTTDSFIEDIRILANRSVGVRLDFPLKDMTKLEVYELGKKFGVGFKNTFSCNTPVGRIKPCGVCGDCVDIERIIEKGVVDNADNPFL